MQKLYLFVIFLTIEKKLILHVIILIKSVLKKDKNHNFYKIFLEKCFCELTKNNHKKLFSWYSNVEIWEREIAKEKFYAAKKLKIGDVNVDKIFISKLMKTKTSSKYLTRCSVKAIRPLVLIMPKMGGYVKTFKVKVDTNNKLMSFHIDDEKLFEKYKVIWTNIEDLKNMESNALSIQDDRYIKIKIRTYSD